MRSIQRRSQTEAATLHWIVVRAAQMAVDRSHLVPTPRAAPFAIRALVRTRCWRCVEICSTHKPRDSTVAVFEQSTSSLAQNLLLMLSWADSFKILRHQPKSILVFFACEIESNAFSHLRAAFPPSAVCCRMCFRSVVCMCVGVVVRSCADDLQPNE